MSKYVGPRIIIDFGKHQIVKVAKGLIGTKITIAVRDPKTGRTFELTGDIPAKTSSMDIRVFEDWVTLYHDSSIGLYTELPMAKPQ